MKKILIYSLFLTFSLQVFADNLSDSNKLFNWAEEHFPQYFNPPRGNTFKIESYLVRYYENTDIYIGTLGDDVYIYSEVFNGLNHLGKIGDFIDVIDRTDEIVENIRIVGSAEFITQTKAALALLKDLAPTAFEKIQTYIGIIDQGELSHMWAYEEPPRYEVDDATSFFSVKWHAGAIAHEATHSELYQAYKSKHGLPVPAGVWSSDEAERICIEYQIDIMKEIDAPQVDIDYLGSLDGSGCDIAGNCD